MTIWASVGGPILDQHSYTKMPLKYEPRELDVGYTLNQQHESCLYNEVSVKIAFHLTLQYISLLYSIFVHITTKNIFFPFYKAALCNNKKSVG